MQRVTNQQEKEYGEETYKVGSTVPGDGMYICVPCGNKMYLKAGAHFGNCLKCLGKDWRLFRKGEELWERIAKKVSDKL